MLISTGSTFLCSLCKGLQIGECRYDRMLSTEKRRKKGAIRSINGMTVASLDESNDRSVPAST